MKSIGIAKLIIQRTELVQAIKVVLLTAGTRAYLMENDPQCLKQLTEAINEAGSPLTAEQEENITWAAEDILSPRAVADYQSWAGRMCGFGS